MLEGRRLQPPARITPSTEGNAAAPVAPKIAHLPHCTRAPQASAETADPRRKPKGKSSSHPFAIPGQQHRQLPSALPFLKHGTCTHKKKQERGGNKKKNKKQGSRAVKSRLGRFWHCKVWHHSPSEHPTAQANDLARGDTFLPQHQRPAKVAPRRDYPTRAGHGRRRSLPALCRAGERDACLLCRESGWLQQPLCCRGGGFRGAARVPRCGCTGEMRASSSFLLRAGGFW